MNIGLKMILVSIIPALIGLSLLSTVEIVKVGNLIDSQVSNIRQEEEESVIDKLKGEVDIAVTLINNMKTEGKGQEECKAAIRNLRFGESGKDYFWIHSFDPRNIERATMIMHPVVTSLDGKDVSDFQDLKRFDRIVLNGKAYPKGAPELSAVPVTNLFVDMNRVCSRDGEGVVRYYWNKPGKEKTVAYSKFSYVKLIPEWGWVIGTGAYADHIDEVVAGISQKLIAEKKDLITTTIWVAGVLLVLLAAVAFFLSRRFSNRINDLKNAALLMAKGDMSQQVKVSSRDEIGQMAVAFEELVTVQREKVMLTQTISEGKLDVDIQVASDADTLGKSLQTMVERLNTAIHDLNSIAVQVDSKAGQISGSSQSLSQGATEQAAALEEITSSMTEIEAQTRTNADSAVAASRLATTARDAGSRGTHQMEEMIRSMEAIRTSSREISIIIKAIDDIAFQTNLLALNAAVEAARAGKHGKGFAVVAQEVRSLAARSAKAAQDTTGLIENAIRKVEEGNQIVSETASVLTEINDGIVKMTDLVNDISTASKEQALGISQISQGLSQIDSVTQQNSANAEETSTAVMELSSQATAVRKILSGFTVRQRVSHQ